MPSRTPIRYNNFIMTLLPGQQLRQVREAQRMSLEQVALATRIRLRYLEALEAEEIEKLPSAAHARGFLRSYAQYLKLDPGPLLAQWDHSVSAEPAAASAAAVPAHSMGSTGLPAVDQVPTDPVGSKDSAEAIFAEIGSRLRRQREALGLSLQDVEDHTHLRLYYLKIIESGRLHELPSSVQGRGMLKNYADFLGLDSEALMLRYADVLQAGLSRRRNIRLRDHSTIQPTVVTAPSSLRRLLTPDFLLTVVLIVLLAAFLIWGTSRVSELRAGVEATATAPSVVDILLPDTPTPSPLPSLAVTLPEANGTLEVMLTPTLQSPVTTQEGGEVETLEAEDAQLTAQPTSDLPPFVGPSQVQVYITVRQRAWMRVTVDDKIEFEGRVIPGSAYLYTGNEKVEVLTGNGAALQVIVNRTDLGVLGIFGQVVAAVYTAEGRITPTPSAAMPEPASQP